MNPQELKTNNYLNHKDFGIVRVWAVYQSGFDITRDGKSQEWFASSYCTPIPLTTEWADYFGFIHTFSGQFQKNNITLSFGIAHAKVFIDNTFITDIEYVHDLQNWYYYTFKKCELDCDDPLKSLPK